MRLRARRVLFAVWLPFCLFANGCQKDQAGSHFRKGTEALAHMNIVAARKEFHLAVGLSPSSRLAGKAFYELGRMDDLYDNDPENASRNYMKSLENLKDGQLRQRVSLDLATDLDHLKKPDEALAILKRLDSPDLLVSYRPRVWDLAARILDHEGRYQEAISYYRKVSGNDPDSFEGQKAQFKIGLLDNMMEDPKAGATALKSFIEKYPTSAFGPVARFNLALAWDQLGQYQQALTLLRSIQETYPNPGVIEERIRAIQKEIRSLPKPAPAVPAPPAKG
ncbi:MAG: tetratricopeptide repeat protein [Leptospirales bacterium]